MMEMKLITKQDIVDGVPKRWEHQYLNCSPHSDNGKITASLNALVKGIDLTESNVNAIIRNTSWTHNYCDVCGKDCDEIIQIGDEMESDSQYICICRECLGKAAKL